MTRKINGSILLEPLSSEPTSAAKGQIYYDTTSGLKVYDGSEFKSTGVSAPHTVYTGTDINCALTAAGQAPASATATHTFTIDSPTDAMVLKMLHNTILDFDQATQDFTEGQSKLKIEVSEKDADTWSDIFADTVLFGATIGVGAAGSKVFANTGFLELYHQMTAGQKANGIDIRITSTVYFLKVIYSGVVANANLYFYVKQLLIRNE